MTSRDRVNYSALYEFNTPAKLATCKTCKTEYSFHRGETGYSTLKRHSESKHAEEFKKAKIVQGNTTSVSAFYPRQEESPKSEGEKIAFMLCCSRHVLPLEWVEDPIVRKTFNISLCAETVRSEIFTLYERELEKVKQKIGGSTVSIALDGWKNTTTGVKHLSFYIIPVHAKKPYFWKSFPDAAGTADEIKKFIEIVIGEMTEIGCKVGAIIGDNAAALQKAIEKFPEIVQLRCSAHSFNLIIRDVFSKIDYAASALEQVDEMIKSGKLRRYPDTRWNARVDKLKEAKAKNPPNPRPIEKTINLLAPLISALNYAQSDYANWETVTKQYTELIVDAENDLFRECLLSHEKKFKNRISRFVDFLNKNGNLDESDKTWVEGFAPKLIDDIESFEMQRIMGDDVSLSNSLDVFKRKILAGFPTSEAAVERGFSRHKAIHCKFRFNLENNLVDRMLFIRENSMFGKDDGDSDTDFAYIAGFDD